MLKAPACRPGRSSYALTDPWTNQRLLLQSLSRFPGPKLFQKTSFELSLPTPLSSESITTFSDSEVLYFASGALVLHSGTAFLSILLSLLSGPSLICQPQTGPGSSWLVGFAPQPHHILFSVTPSQKQMLHSCKPDMILCLYLPDLAFHHVKDVLFK